jgi:hypothetical protein
MAQESIDYDDIGFVEHRHDVRIIASVPGRYWFDRQDPKDEIREYSCRAINISTHAIALAGPVIPTHGQRIHANIQHFGKLEGAVIRLLERGFVMDIIANDEERASLSTKIEWFELHKNHDIGDRRDNARFVPKARYSTLLLPDGTIHGCFLLDLSIGGTAVSADIVPQIGAVIGVGKVVGRVVRHFPGGFALKFITVQNESHVEALATSQRTLATT